MTMHGEVEEHKRIVLKNTSGTLGMIRAYSLESKRGTAGGDASFRIALDWNTIPGVSQMTINLNHWDVWLEDDPELVAHLLDEFLPLETH